MGSTTTTAAQRGKQPQPVQSRRRDNARATWAFAGAGTVGSSTSTMSQRPALPLPSSAPLVGCRRYMLLLRSGNYPPSDNHGPVTGSSAQQVTLWQFGVGRVAGGEITLSLVPLGTVTEANGQLATTYLYQVVNNQESVTQVDGTGLVTTETLAVTNSRTIIASASGWFEHAPPLNGLPHIISCGFFNASFGECFDETPATTTLANNGVPTPLVLGVSTSIPASAIPSSTATFVFATDSSSLSLSLPTSPSRSSKSSTASASAGTLVAAILGSIAATILIAGFLLWFLRRRRLRGTFEEKSDAEARNTIQPFDRGAPVPTELGAAHWSFADARPDDWRMHAYNQSGSTSTSTSATGKRGIGTGNSRPIPEVFMSSTSALASDPASDAPRTGNPLGASMSLRPISQGMNEITTAELALALYQRVHNSAGTGIEGRDEADYEDAASTRVISDTATAAAVVPTHILAPTSSSTAVISGREGEADDMGGFACESMPTGDYARLSRRADNADVAGKNVDGAGQSLSDCSEAGNEPQNLRVALCMGRPNVDDNPTIASVVPPASRRVALVPQRQPPVVISTIQRRFRRVPTIPSTYKHPLLDCSPPFRLIREDECVTRLFVSFALLAMGGSAQQVTLWQFGAGRLAEAEISLSLVPLGTVTDANGGLATTYLFQAVNNQELVTQVDGTGLVTTETLAVTSSRTIIASASGWFEHLPPVNGVTDFISCGFFNASFGGCFNGNTATTALGNSGVPTPEVFGVSTSIFATATSTPAPAATASFTFATDSSSLSLPLPTGTSPPTCSSKLSKTSAPAGTLVAAILGSIAATVFIAGFLCCLLRRRRLRRAYGEKSDAEARNTIQPFDRGAPAHWSFANPPTSEAFAPGERRMHAYNQSASTSRSGGSSGSHTYGPGNADFAFMPATIGTGKRGGAAQASGRYSRAVAMPIPEPFMSSSNVASTSADALASDPAGGASRTGNLSVNDSEMHLTTAELALALYRRVHNSAGNGIEGVRRAPSTGEGTAPPVYTQAAAM
ncbi:hypothetical protein HMN09_00371500 [Mycena chlorophos]|uniref:Uncharacterized protein n=1 Tax=Mycena chlorophos TaxID=658473 RepID=A0A8H6TJU3_MYCCL|nr:hypothetical protein HMN09_00371500 [Mycena chlorophos]